MFFSYPKILSDIMKNIEEANYRGESLSFSEAKLEVDSDQEMVDLSRKQNSESQDNQVKKYIIDPATFETNLNPLYRGRYQPSNTERRSCLIKGSQSNDYEEHLYHKSAADTLINSPSFNNWAKLVSQDTEDSVKKLIRGKQ